MRAFLLVLAFWGFIGLIVGYSLVLALAIAAGLYVVVGLLVALPIIALSVFMWFAFSEVF